MIDVGRDVHAALVFLQSEARRVPALGEQARGIVDGKASKVAQIGAGNALVKVLVMQRTPLAGQNVLAPNGTERGGEQQGERKSGVHISFIRRI